MERFRHNPPFVATWLLRIILPKKDAMFLLDDFEDCFNDILRSKSLISAYFWYWRQLFITAPEFLKNSMIRSSTMLRSYIKIAVRNILNNKVFSLINIFGLSTGIAVSCLLFLFTFNELEYDHIHKKINNIFMVFDESKTEPGSNSYRSARPPMVDVLLEEYPEVLSATRLWNKGPGVAYNGEFYSPGANYIDEGYFDIFDVKWIKGSRPGNGNKMYAVLTAETAEQIFGNEDPVGKNLTVDFGEPYEYVVTGVVEDLPDNSTYRAGILLPYESILSIDWVKSYYGWKYKNIQIFVLLNENADPQKFEEKLQNIAVKYFNPEIAQKYRLIAAPFKGFHLEITGGKKTILLLLLLAGSILLLAGINFTNLSIVKSMNRAGEIGLRKVFGANRSQLVKQFLGESLIITFISLASGIVIAQLFLPKFNSLFGLSLKYSAFIDMFSVAALSGLAVITGLFAGGYPAIVLSKLKPVESIRNKIDKVTDSKFSVRNIFVILQFTISIFLIAGTIVIWKQIVFMQDYDLQFDKDNLLVVRSFGSDRSKANAFKNKIDSISEITATSFTSSIPGDYQRNYSRVIPSGWEKPDPLRIHYTGIDDSYFSIINCRIMLGRDFSKEFAMEQTNVIINESAFQAFGWNDVENKTLKFGNSNYNVVGVVKNFHHESLHMPIEPVLYFYGADNYNEYRFFILKYASTDVSGLLGKIKNAWTETDIKDVLSYFFVDEKFDTQYRNEVRIAKVTGFFSVLAIIISALGLLALASFIVLQRTKEIGIRKVLGASTRSILVQLTRQYFVLTLVANAIALPAAYTIFGKWLEEYPFKIEMGFWIFAAAALVSLIISVLTIGYHTVKAALTNPVESLRYE